MQKGKGPQTTKNDSKCCVCSARCLDRSCAGCIQQPEKTSRLSNFLFFKSFRPIFVQGIGEASSYIGRSFSGAKENRRLRKTQFKDNGELSQTVLSSNAQKESIKPSYENHTFSTSGVLVVMGFSASYLKIGNL